jgi:hypothetical protein
MIHAVGLTDADFDDAKRRNLSIVWSPMSNLLLYGETLDVGAVKRKGINMALGVDWTPTGSRNILDEIKIAKRWILSQKVKEFSPQTLNKDLVEMATLNAAKALRIAGRWGKIAPNYAADILLVKKPSSMNSPDAAYAALVDANQKDLNLVMVDGNPVYGEASYIQAASSKLGGPTPEIVIDGNNAASACKGMQKAVRLAKSKNETLESKLEKGGLQSTSVSKLKAFLTPRVAMLDPLFTCEHDDILRKMGKNPQGSFTYVDRFPVFIENEVPRNKSNRVSERVKYPTLKEDFTPLAKPAVLK